MVIDRVQQQITRNRSGIQWTMFSHFEDLDFANDLAEILTTRQHLQEKISMLNMYTETTG